MDLSKLWTCHQLALADMVDASDVEVRQWAESRAGYFAMRIVVMQQQLRPPELTGWKG